MDSTNYCQECGRALDEDESFCKCCKKSDSQEGPAGCYDYAQSKNGLLRETLGNSKFYSRRIKILFVVLAPILLLTAIIAVKYIGKPGTNRAGVVDYLNDAERHVNSKDYDQALIDFERTLKLDPNNDLAYKGRSFVYYQLNRFEEALSDSNRSIELNPSSADAYVGRGYIYNALRMYDDALNDFNTAISLASDYAPAYAGLGYTHMNLSNYQESLSYYDRSIELDPNLLAGFNGRGYLYNQMGLYQKALDDLNRAIEIAPGEAKPYKNRGISYYCLGQKQDAITDFQKALEIDPDLQEAKDYIKMLGISD